MDLHIDYTDVCLVVYIIIDWHDIYYIWENKV